MILSLSPQGLAGTLFSLLLGIKGVRHLKIRVSDPKEPLEKRILGQDSAVLVQEYLEFLGW